jgi:ABC-type transporter Mla MlaB component
MTVTLIGNEHGCRLVFAGSMTYEFAREMEDRIIDALRRYRHFEIDLSAVHDVDLCGLHLLGMLQNVGGQNARIVADSQAVQQASKRLLASYRGPWLRGNRQERGSAASPA